MLKRKNKFLLVFLLTFVLVLSFLILNGCATKKVDLGEDTALYEESEEVFTLVTGLAAPTPWHDGFWVFKEILEERTNMRIDVRGGPEIIDMKDLGEAVSMGEIDMGLLADGHIGEMIPIVYGGSVRQLSPLEDREKGTFEFRQKVFAEHNLHLLGKTGGFCRYRIFLKEPVESIDDFSGLIIRGIPLYLEFIEMLGAELVVIPPAEIYTALERGTVDGFMWPELGAYDMGLHEVVNYMVEPTFFEAEHFIIMNLNRWEGLSDSQQQALTEIIIETEGKIEEIYKSLVEEEKEKLLKHLEMIEFSPEEEKIFNEYAYESAKQVLLQKEPKYGKEYLNLLLEE